MMRNTDASRHSRRQDYLESTPCLVIFLQKSVPSGALCFIHHSRILRIDLPLVEWLFLFQRPSGTHSRWGVLLDNFWGYTMQDFQFAHIVPHRGKGVLFADGTQMLQRQGIANTINGNLGKGHLEVRLTAVRARSDLFYEAGPGSAQHVATKEYFSLGDSPEYIAPVKLQEEALNWIERETCDRPAGIRQQVLSYVFSSRDSRLSNCADDILLLRYRYDSATRSIYDVDGDSPIAEFGSDRENPFVVSAVSLDKLVMDVDTATAFEKALRIGFHQCDINQGVDYCMRRLSWLASGYFLEMNNGKKTFTYVLKRDAEHPAELANRIVR